MAGLNIEQMRSIQWGRTYDWELSFVGAPAPFNQFFPAVDVEENLYAIEDQMFAIGTTTIGIPKTSSSFSLRITFLDDEAGTLKQWLTEWVNTTIFVNGRVAPLESCVKILTVAKTDGKRNQVKSTTYRVYPKGSLFYHGSSDSGVATHTIEVIVSEIM